MTLAIGASGAVLFRLIGFPAADLTGPAVIVALASVAGVRVNVPPLLRDACFVILGLGIGSSVTPEVIATARAWPLSLMALAATLVASLFSARWLLVRGFGYDRMTALLASTPGHLSYVLGISAELRADVSRVAIVQSIRVLLLTVLVPLIISVSGATGDVFAEARTLGALPLAGLGVLAVGAGLLLRRLHVPAAFLLGGLCVSAVSHATEITPGTLPAPLTLVAFVVMGALIGTRFDGLSGAEVRAALGAGLCATLVACGFAALGAVAMNLATGLPAAALLLAFAPGGVEVMAALAVQTGLEPAFVAAHHVCRLLILTLVVPLLLHRGRTRTF